MIGAVLKNANGPDSNGVERPLIEDERTDAIRFRQWRELFNGLCVTIERILKNKQNVHGDAFDTYFARIWKMQLTDVQKPTRLSITLTINTTTLHNVKI